MSASDEWKVGPPSASISKAIADGYRAADELSSLRDRLRSTAALLRDFYVAWAKPEWKEGECAPEAASRVVGHLAELEQEGIEEARLPELELEGDG